MINLEKFDYSTKRAIFSQCQAVNCPNLEIEFIEEFIKREYTVIFVTVNQPYYKIKKEFEKVGGNGHLFFIDCVSNIPKSKNSDKQVRYVNTGSLEKIQRAIEKIWKSLPGKKLLFFDCGEILVVKFGVKETFNFVHSNIQKMQRDGVVIFCFLKETMDKPTENIFRHLFDESIFL
ncbi:hypothetical protein HZC07_04415 [Candidatus Micrarchaeota archaeon]|nr:hypothetical protein [Candidatus Micrarchaeota archaeon]